LRRPDLAILACFLGLPVAAHAQTAPAIGGSAEVFAGGELESYLRTLSTLGIARLHQTSLRQYSPVEARWLLTIPESLAHPWAARLRERGDGAGTSWVRLVRPAVAARVNSGYPWGINDGAVWAGRGATLWASAGVAVRWGVLTVVANPLVSAAQNADFPIVDSGRPGRLRFEDWQHAGIVDYPQRFGDGVYSLVDPGESMVRLDAAGVALGFSTAHEWWGPTQRYPYLLGTNAAGFPHLFLGTSRPLDLRLVRAHARLLWGQLDESHYFEAEGGNAYLTRPRRFAAGLATVLQPGALPNLELGLARFIHAPWPDGGGIPRRYWTRPFEGIFKIDLPVLNPSIPSDSRSLDGENQLASVFARFTVPQHGFELYAELGREDHPWDGRYLMLTFDEQSSTSFGFAKAWRRVDGTVITRLRGEAINFQMAQVDLYRGGAPTYLHPSGTNQGHTQRGQILGAGVGVGGAAGSFLAWDRLDPNGRWTVEWSRTVRHDSGLDSTARLRPTDGLDVVHAIGAERLLFVGSRELTAGASLGRDFNRDFAGDRSNLSVYVSVLGWR